MPQPTLSSVHVNVPLSNLSVAYLQSQNDFVASRVFPIVPSDKQSNVYYKYTKDDWFRDEAKPHAPGSESSGSGYSVTNTDSYSCVKYSIHKDIPDDVRSNSDAVLNPDREATEFVTRRLLLRQEIQWAADFFTTGVWGTDVTGGTNFTQWSDAANSDPIGDVRTGIASVFQNTGFKPNKLVMGYQVFLKLIDHPDIVARIQGGATTGMPALVNEQFLARIFGLDEVIVCGAVKNTAAEGATGSYSFVQGKSALLCYSAPSPGLMTASAGYTFLWSGVSMGLGLSIGVKKFRLERNGSDRVEGSIAFANKVIASDMGYFFASAVA